MNTFLCNRLCQNRLCQTSALVLVSAYCCLMALASAFTGHAQSVASPAVFQARLFPQPSATETTLEYTLAEPSDVRVAVVNVLGMTVSSTSLGKQQSGSQRFALNLAGVSAGAYFVRLT
jgi:uncharacterized protein YdeI (BOF family)